MLQVIKSGNGLDENGNLSAEMIHKIVDTTVDTTFDCIHRAMSDDSDGSDESGSEEKVSPNEHLVHDMEKCLTVSLISSIDNLLTDKPENATFDFWVDTFDDEYFLYTVGEEHEPEHLKVYNRKKNKLSKIVGAFDDVHLKDDYIELFDFYGWWVEDIKDYHYGILLRFYNDKFTFEMNKEVQRVMGNMKKNGAKEVWIEDYECNRYANVFFYVICWSV